MSNDAVETAEQAAAWDAVLADSLDFLDALEDEGRAFLADHPAADDTW